MGTLLGYRTDTGQSTAAPQDAAAREQSSDADKAVHENELSDVGQLYDSAQFFSVGEQNSPAHLIWTGICKE